jgi:hypothetical protein
LQSEKTSPSHVDLPSLIFVEATGACIPIGSGDILLAALYISPGLASANADTTELISFRNECTLAGDLNAKHQFWNSAVSTPSSEKILQLFDLDDFEILAPQCPAHYSQAGNGYVLDIVVHKNINNSL